MKELQGGFALLGVAGVASAITWAVREVARRKQLLDRPNDRSAHSVPTPRLGGIGIMVAFLTASMAFVLSDARGWTPAATVLACTAGVAAVGLVDDLRPLRARTRFALQLLAAVVVVLPRLPVIGTAMAPLDALLPDPALATLAVVWIVWMTNLFNFMDGIDGLAAGQAILASLGLAAAAGSGATASMLLLLAAASAGFLFFNFPPATIFMGDVGSTAIGFFLACVPLLPSPRPVPVEAVWIACGLFILDATSTLIRRLRNGERWYAAHRTHWYQRPLGHGIPHRTITLWAYLGMTLLAAATALYGQVDAAARSALLVAPFATFLPAVRAVRRLDRRVQGTEPAEP